MGTYVNGLYVPTLEETGWDDEVNADIRSLASMGINVLNYGADPSGVNFSDAAFQAAADAVIVGSTQRDRTVWMPGGTYKFAEGQGVTSNWDGVRWVGIGTGSGSGVTIQPKNAYAFTGSGRVQNVFENISIEMQSGSTSGGGWDYTNGSRNGWFHCKVQGVSGYAGSMFRRTNSVFDKWVDCIATGGGIGFDLQGGVAQNTNLVQLVRCTGQSNSIAGFYIDYPQTVVMTSCDAESNTGYGVQVGGSGQDFQIHGGWFEGNTLDSLRISGTKGALIMGAHFASGATAAGANHITLTGTTSMTTIISSLVISPANNKSLAIGSSVDATTLIGCMGFQDSDNLITDSGTRTLLLNTGRGQHSDDSSVREGGYRIGLTRGLFSFAGSPEGNVTADKGSLCMDTTNGAAYIKTTNSANTGWKAITHA